MQCLTLTHTLSEDHYLITLQRTATVTLVIDTLQRNIVHHRYNSKKQQQRGKEPFHVGAITRTTATLVTDTLQGHIGTKQEACGFCH